MPQCRILIVDDDPKVRALLARCFEGDGIHTAEAEDAPTALRLLAETDPDLVTLDLRLGADSGLDLARQIRRQSDVPIMMVTGKTDVTDRIVGLEIGADDYVTKPFHVREVLARVHAILRRRTKPSPEAPATRVAHFDGWEVRPDRFELVDPDGELRELTAADFKLLMALVDHPKRILSRAQLMDFIGGPDWSPLDRTIDNQIARLRKKIEADPSVPRLIKTARGIGYAFTADVHWDQRPTPSGARPRASSREDLKQ